MLMNLLNVITTLLTTFPGRSHGQSQSISSSMVRLSRRPTGQMLITCSQSFLSLGHFSTYYTNKYIRNFCYKNLGFEVRKKNSRSEAEPSEHQREHLFTEGAKHHFTLKRVYSLRFHLLSAPCLLLLVCCWVAVK